MQSRDYNYNLLAFQSKKAVKKKRQSRKKGSQEKKAVKKKRQSRKKGSQEKKLNAQMLFASKIMSSANDTNGGFDSSWGTLNVNDWKGSVQGY